MLDMTIRSRLRIILSRVFSIPVGDLPEAINTETVATWDSLTHLALIEQLEKEFGIKIDQPEAVSLLSEADIIQLLAKKVRGVTHRAVP